jgi:hypothetical protein
MFKTREKFPELCNVGITLEVEREVLKNNLPLCKTLGSYSI